MDSISNISKFIRFISTFSRFKAILHINEPDCFYGNVGFVCEFNINVMYQVPRIVR